tara:strand:+ start:6526 stop:6711 length:186 start_codon:yes stop_codon:yes gene_type:complete
MPRNDSGETEPTPNSYGRIRTACKSCRFAGDVILINWQPPPPITRDTDINNAKHRTARPTN